MDMQWHARAKCCKRGSVTWESEIQLSVFGRGTCFTIGIDGMNISEHMWTYLNRMLNIKRIPKSVQRLFLCDPLWRENARPQHLFELKGSSTSVRMCQETHPLVSIIYRLCLKIVILIIYIIDESTTYIISSIIRPIRIYHTDTMEIGYPGDRDVGACPIEILAAGIPRDCTVICKWCIPYLLCFS